MPLKLHLDSLDGLPEPISKEYAPYSGNDAALKGKYVLNLEASSDGYSFENVGALKRALAEEKENRRKHAERLKKFSKEDGTTLEPEDVLQALARLERIDSGDLSADERVKARIEAITRQLEEKHSKTAAKLTEERNTLSARLHKEIKGTAIAEAIAATGGIPKALKPLINTMVDIRFAEDGSHQLIVLDEQGQPRISPAAGNQGYMTLKELLEELKKDPDLRGNFVGVEASGGGLNGDGRSPGSKVVIDPTLSPTQRLTEARKRQARRV